MDKEIECQCCGEMFIAERANNTTYCSKQCAHDIGAIIISAKKQECRDYLRQQKAAAGKCEECGETNILLLEFAHHTRDGKIDVHECHNIEILK